MALNADQILRDAEKLLKQGRVDQAVGRLRVLRDRGSREAQALNRAGDMLLQHGAKDEALSLFGKLAADFADKGFLPKAIAIHKKILRVHPDHPGTLYQLGELYLKQKLTGDGLSFLQRAAEEAKGQGDADVGRKAVERLARAEPRNPAHRMRLAQLHAAAGDTDKAVSELLRLGASTLRRGDHAASEESYRKAAELAPTEPKTAIGIATCLSRQERHADAVAALEAFGKTDDPQLIGELARCRFSAGQFELAADTLFGEQANSLKPDVFVHAFGSAKPDQADELWSRFEKRFGDGELEPARTLLQAIGAGGGALKNRAEELLGQLLEQHGEPASPTEQAAPSPEPPVAAPEAEPPPAPRPPEVPSAEAPQFEESDLLAAEAPAVPIKRADEEFVSGRMTQSEILEKYGLADKALEQVEEVIARFPGHVDAQQRRIELLRARKAKDEIPGALVGLALARRAAGDTDGARNAAAEAKRKGSLSEETVATLTQLGLLGEAAPASAAAAAEVGPSAGEPAAAPEVVIDFEEEPADEPVPAATRQPAATVAEQEPPPAADSIDLLEGADEDLSAITKALESEFPEARDAEPAAESEESVDEVFEAFKRHVEEEVGQDDFKTLYDLGIAYKEMGLLDEAVEAFKLCLESPELKADCCTMLALCFRDRGDAGESASWYRAAINARSEDLAAATTLRYDLAELLAQDGKDDEALELLRVIVQVDPSYRDVQARISDIEARLQG